jgi:ABC-type spermidine/putrescine transport system permease subunit I
MGTNRLYSLALTIYLAAALVGWAVLVPGWMSGATLGSIVVVGFAVGAVSLMTLRAGRSTRSVAHVLYETETAARDHVKAAAPAESTARP